jgi:hypothetical protein
LQQLLPKQQTPIRQRGAHEQKQASDSHPENLLRAKAACEIACQEIPGHRRKKQPEPA